MEVSRRVASHAAIGSIRVLRSVVLTETDLLVLWIVEWVRKGLQQFILVIVVLI